MNLKSLRQKIKNITDYSPELSTYNADLDDLLNDAYLYLWTTKRWTFGTKEYYFKFIPDITPTRDTTTSTAITAIVSKGSRAVTFSAGMDRLTREYFEGQPIEIQSREYIISKILNSGAILLDSVFLGTSNATESNWKIKKRWYDLPQDSIELLTLGHRDVPYTNNGTGLMPPYGKLIGLAPRKAEEINLRMDYAASYAEAYVWSPSVFIPEAHKTTVTTTLEVGTSDGFPESTYLEVCWAFVKDGKVGALSEPGTITFPTEDNTTYTTTINFISWDDQSIVADTANTKDTGPTQWEGFQKKVFWNANYNRATGERRGLPIWREFNQGGTTRNNSTYLLPVLAEDTATSVNITNFNQINSGNDIYIEYDGQHNRIRPYPRVDAWDQAIARQDATAFLSKVDQNYLREGVARYYYKPSLMGFDTDSPEMPYEFHQLVIYKALETIYDKVGMQSNAEQYRRRFEKEIKQLQKRYCDHIDTMVQRGQFQLSDRAVFYDPTSLRNNS
jgi:hypothetical protein